MKLFKSVIWLLAGLVMGSLDVSGQVHTAWMRRYASSELSTNQPVAMALDTAGNLLIGGQGSSANGDSDYVILKYDPNGTLLWQTSYVASPTNDQVRAMVVDLTGNAIVTGTGGTVKLSADGALQWAVPEAGTSVAVDPTGDVFLVGFSMTNYATLKIHGGAGTNLWVTTESAHADRVYDRSQKVLVDNSGNAYSSGYVLCYLVPGKLGYFERRTVCYDPSGNRRWTSPQPFGECRFTNIRTVASNLAPDGSLTVVSQDDPGAPIIVRYSASGEQEWLSDALLYYADSGVRSVANDAAGNVYVTGRFSNPVTLQRLIRTDKVSPAGTHLWAAFYEAPSSRSGNAVGIDRSGNVFVAGQVPGPAGTQGNDFILLAYSSSGREQWVRRYDGPAQGDDVATAIAVAADGSVYVTGWSTTSSNLVEITTIKYAPVTPVAVQTNGSVALQFVTAPGESNRVEATADFMEWEDLGFGLGDLNGLLRFTDTNAVAFPFRFYRTKH